MTQYVNDIEHPVQSWWPNGYADDLETAHKAALAERYQVDADDIKFIIDALYTTTAFNHARRSEHEDKNLRKMGLYLPARRHWYPAESYTDDLREYEQLAGRQESAGRFIAFFSRIAHAAFLGQDAEQPAEPFDHISLELGGKRQFGDWEATGSVDAMIREVPEQLVHAHPQARITVYGEPKQERYEHERVKYLPDADRHFTLFPRPEPDTSDIRTAIIRRWRPVADITVPDESDIVLIKESNFLLVLDYVEAGRRQRIEAGIRRALETERRKQMDYEAGRSDQGAGRIMLEDCEATDIVAELTDAAIQAPKGTTKDILPSSAHYVQGVGEEYAWFRSRT